MATLRLFLLAPILMLSCCKAPHQGIAQLPQPSDAALDKEMVQILRIVKELHPGMTRADIEVNFQPESGFRPLVPSRFVYKKCHMIKLDVTFTSSGTFLPSDTIVSASQPFIADQQPM